SSWRSTCRHPRGGSCLGRGRRAAGRERNRVLRRDADPTSDCRFGIPGGTWKLSRLPHPKTHELTTQINAMLGEMDRHEAELPRGGNVRQGVIDEDHAARVELATPDQQLEDLRVGLHHPDIARDDEVIEAIQKRENGASQLELLPIEVAEGVD